MSILDDFLAQNLEPNYGDDDDINITPPRVPDYHRNDENLNDLLIFGESKENDAESSPPPSQPRPQYTQTQKSPPKQQREKKTQPTKTSPSEARHKKKINGSKISVG